MKKLLLSILFLCFPFQSFAETPTDFIRTLSDQIITNVLKTADTQEEKTKRFEGYFLSALDVQTIGKNVLGRHWKNATEEERKDFLNAFTDMALKSWADRFNMYTGQEISFTNETPAQGKNQVFVNSFIQDDPNPISVIWRVSNKNGEYKIVDIVVEGVSMTLSYRNEYDSFLRDKSLPELSEQLKKQAEQFVSKK